MTYNYKKTIFLSLITFSCLYSMGQTKLASTYIIKGKMVLDTIVLKDKTLVNEINQIISNPNYKPVSKNDTVFNKTGKPQLVKISDSIFGAAFALFRYDQAKRLISITGYNRKKEIKAFEEDIAVETFAYDSIGNKIEVRYFGKDEKPLRTELSGPAITRYKYDNHNWLIEEDYLDDNEKPLNYFAKVLYKYNEKGNLLVEEHLDGAGNILSMQHFFPKQ